MASPATFDLPAFMLSWFNRVDFGADLFGQRPTGIRFEIGLEHVARAATLFEFLFAAGPDCILVSQDWVTDGALDPRFTQLFRTVGVFLSEPTQFQVVDVSPLDETPYRLTWTRCSLGSLNALQMFQAVAHRERAGTPKISSGVFVIDPRSRVILHMYDDRGLDVLAAELSTLKPLYERFREWILEDQRHRVTVRFSQLAQVDS